MPIHFRSSEGRMKRRADSDSEQFIHTPKDRFQSGRTRWRGNSLEVRRPKISTMSIRNEVGDLIELTYAVTSFDDSGLIFRRTKERSNARLQLQPEACHGPFGCFHGLAPPVRVLTRASWWHTPSSQLFRSRREATALSRGRPSLPLSASQHALPIARSARRPTAVSTGTRTAPVASEFEFDAPLRHSSSNTFTVSMPHVSTPQRRPARLRAATSKSRACPHAQMCTRPFTPARRPR